eukprot:1142847-Pelagomonas_calceolata.AAC.1
MSCSTKQPSVCCSYNGLGSATLAVRALPTQFEERRHIGSKSRESPSPEGKREASLMSFWQHAAPGHQNYNAFLFSVACLVEGMGSIDSPAQTQEDCVKSDLCTLKSFGQLTVLLL